MKSTNSIHSIDSHVELFESDLLNKLSRTNLKATLIGYPLAGMLILILGLIYSDIPFYWLLAGVVVGFLGWTLLEYVLHRFVNHGFERIPMLRRFQYIFHGIHHDFPNREDKLLMPPAPWVLVLAFLLGLFYLFFGELALGIVPGLVFGYVAYAYIHYKIHQPHAPKWMENYMIHHQLHHHRHHDKAFGVTTALWDRVFGTMPPERIGWNKKKAD